MENITLHDFVAESLENMKHFESRSALQDCIAHWMKMVRYIGNLLDEDNKTIRKYSESFLNLLNEHEFKQYDEPIRRKLLYWFRELTPEQAWIYFNDPSSGELYGIDEKGHESLIEKVEDYDHFMDWTSFGINHKP